MTDTQALVERLRAMSRHEHDDLSIADEAADALERMAAEVDFLVARASKAGSVTFSGERWTGMSSNALVTVAFGGSDDFLPCDAGDLAACYRTVIRMPPHLRTEAVMAQLALGEAKVGSEDLAWAREKTNWPGALSDRGRG